MKKKIDQVIFKLKFTVSLFFIRVIILIEKLYLCDSSLYNV